MSNFIVLEGIDGSGKSSVAESFKNDHKDVYLTKEPTETDIGNFAQKIAHEKTPAYLDLFLYLADRVEHIEDIKSVLDEEKPVLCDRYWGSTAAYQAANGEINLQYVEDVQRPFVLEPDLTVLFDLDPQVSLERITDREKKSKYERTEFLKKVRNNYLKLADKYGWEVIDAENSLEVVKKEFYDLVEKYI